MVVQVCRLESDLYRFCQLTNRFRFTNEILIRGRGWGLLEGQARAGRCSEKHHPSCQGRKRSLGQKKESGQRRSSQEGPGGGDHVPAWSLSAMVFVRHPGSVGRDHDLSEVVIYEMRSCGEGGCGRGTECVRWGGAPLPLGVDGSGNETQVVTACPHGQ